ncbi:MAG: hypothetical protein Q8M16_16990 [Pirellulaceae bacterium]|nr:hypothetical protein [Pirellulaceae bacterium]
MIGRHFSEFLGRFAAVFAVARCLTGLLNSMNGFLHQIVVSVCSDFSNKKKFGRRLFLTATFIFLAGWNCFAGGLELAAAKSGTGAECTSTAVRHTGACSAAWCPFCTALKPTLAEEIEATDAVVFAKVVGPGQLTEDGFDRKLRLQVSRILKGKSFVTESEEFETIAPATLEPGQECLVMGVLTDRMMWSTPMKLSERSREYILAVQTLPIEGADRVKFFLNYLEDSESFMAFDAYDEFARAPYDIVKAIKADMNRENLVKWVQDPEVSINRKRLYFTLIGVCGLPEDLPLLERLISSPEKRDRAALDSLIACYLTLAGADGVKLIEDRFLRSQDADYVDTYAAVAALRFHGTESDVIPVPRIVEAVRLLLDRPEVADLVIADLARWKDWTVTDRLVEMFKNANEKTAWVRVPIVHFLRVNPDPTSKAKIEELRAVDPQSVRRALAFFELEAAMQTDADAEDAEFEQQLKQAELEKSKEQEEGKGQEGKGQGSGKGQGEDPKSGTTGSLPKTDGSDDEGVRLTAFRPIVESLNSKEPAEIALTSLAVEGTGPETADVLATSIPHVANTVTLPVSPNITANNSMSPNSSARNRSETRTEADPSNYLWWIVGVPMLVNGLLLALTWSILNGTFSRLFC